MSDHVQVELNMPASPGALLKEQRLAQGMSEREAADRLNWMPDYVAVIESNRYEKLRNPAFARGYVKAYARLVGLDEDAMVAAFDKIYAENASNMEQRKKQTEPLHLQKTGVGVVVGVSVLILLVVFMWWRSG